ncbi:hypothetical protein [Paenibacillus sinopodophylli]|uniref:hypothetical protein n=1 Tax=Paenibacillus sinopodophylli TaxID=1837342 RepID=UPI00110D1BA1|nr:hypothetical protein [Paenibacillus sinopodophylli]
MNHMQLTVPEYRRKGFSLLGHAFALFFKNSWPILLIVAIVSIPIEAIKNYYFFEPDHSGIFFPDGKMDTIVDLLFLSSITPMVVHYILGRVAGAESSFKQSLLWGLKKWPRMIVYNFLQGAVILAGIFVFVVPGVLFAVWLLLLPIVVALFDTSRVNPMTISREFARKRYFKFIGYGLAGYAMAIVFVIIQGIIFTLLVSQSWITATIFDMFFNWFFQLATVVLLLVFLQVNTERVSQEQEAIKQAL